MKKTGYAGKKAVVVGLARSGESAAMLLARSGGRVFVTESAQNPRLGSLAKKLARDGITVELGAHRFKFYQGADLIVVSPGVEPDNPVVLWAKKHKVDVIGEIELAASLCPATIIAVTGTNGKTTTTTLIGEILKKTGRRVFVLGNIGVPFASCVEQMNEGDFVSLEVSSFQLETIKRFCPKVAVILNMTPDHLDRYGTEEEYYRAKARIMKNQKEGDVLILNARDPRLVRLKEKSRARVIFFNTSGQMKKFPGFDPNQYACLALAGALKIPYDACVDVFKNFKGVEHRLEFVRTLSGVTFINDSKATNIDSAVWALSHVKTPLVLIAGGKDKNSDYATVLALLKKRVKYMVLIGQAKEKIRSCIEGHLPYSIASDLKEAVAVSFGKAARGDTVLLSPMCASFDMFRDYTERGRVFKEHVCALS